MKKPKIIDTEVVATSRLFAVEQVSLVFSNGQMRQFERIRGRAHGAVMILPLLDSNTILLIREYAVGMEDHVLAFPKGSIENEEDYFDTANRELMEEVGYGARQFEWLAELSTSPSYMTARMKIIIAKDLYPQQLVGDEPEPIEVVPWPLTKIDELLAHPQFHEARSVAALLLFLRQTHAAS